MSEQQISTLGYLRLNQIIGDKKQNIPPIIPVGRTTWFRGVKDGLYPQPIKLSKRTIAWRAEEIQKLVEDLAENKHEI